MRGNIAAPGDKVRLPAPSTRRRRPRELVERPVDGKGVFMSDVGHSGACEAHEPGIRKLQGEIGVCPDGRRGMKNWIMFTQAGSAKHES